MTRDRSGVVTSICVVIGDAARAMLLDKKAEAPIATAAATTAFSLMRFIVTILYCCWHPTDAEVAAVSIGCGWSGRRSLAALSLTQLARFVYRR